MTQYSKITLLLVSFVGIYFFYKGVTTVPWEGDSLAYHIPIAQNILQGKFTNLADPLFYYPAASESILAIFMALHLPLNLFNLLAWCLLFYLLFRLAKTFNLNTGLSVIFASTICLLPSIIRLISTQTADIWLAVFWIWTVIILERKKINYWLLGIALGVLIGTKYSGPLFVVPMIAIYYKKLITPKVIIAPLPVIFLGLSWYLRNWLFMGHPLYPTGAEGFKLLNWQLWKTPLYTHSGTLLLISALISEYLIWCFAPFASLKTQFSKLKFLGWANLLICLFLPTWPENIVSDLRYTYVAFVPLMLLTFLYFQKKDWGEKISLVALVTMFSVLPQLDYYPKLFIALSVALLLMTGEKYPKPGKAELSWRH